MMTDFDFRFLVDTYDIYHEQFEQFKDLLKDVRHQISPHRQFDDFYDICAIYAGDAVVDMGDNNDCEPTASLVHQQSLLSNDVVHRFRIEFVEYVEEVSDMYWSIDPYNEYIDKFALYDSLSRLFLITVHLILDHVIGIMRTMPQSQWIFERQYPEESYPMLLDDLQVTRLPYSIDLHCGLRFRDTF